ncbi:hypothetical protein TNIN_413861 [Trichonephila inaurata madagascariensis]|uniref:EGF-like domain-containing protein n=1 Tax=Trichonephila inaurata madagascariensis TaxID=2747483 RepID=A0A8X6WWB2_9ARAC|nr:hypothetical protein TNIN_413861 [Trichonephila inaurata madagascariensis]
MDTTFDFDVANEELNSARDVNDTIITVDPMDITLNNTVEPETNTTVSDDLTDLIKDLNFTIPDDDSIDNWTSRESSDFTHYLNTTYEPSSSSLVVNVSIQPGSCEKNRCVYGSCKVVGDSYSCYCQEGYSGAYCDVSVKNQKCKSY